jgi:hypothetical protein
MSELTLNNYVMDLRLNLNRLEGVIESVEASIGEGDLDGAAMVLGDEAGKAGRFTDSWGALQKTLRKEGADPQRGVHRGSADT